MVYQADQDTDDVRELYSVPIGGGGVTKLNPSLPVGRAIDPFLISSDSGRVVYRADQDTATVNEVYSVPIGGGAVTKLNPSLPVGRIVQAFLISADSARVVYRANQDTDNLFELYSVPIGGGGVTKLNLAPPAEYSVSSVFSISPDSARVVYRAAHDATLTGSLYSVAIGGGSVVQLNPHLTVGHSAANFSISPDSARVVYVADQDTDTVSELYSTVLVPDADEDGVFNACDSDDDNDSFLDVDDCQALNASVWAIPGEARDLQFGGDLQTLIWTAPAAPGSVAVLYDTLRTTNFVSFDVCVETNGADTATIDPVVPGPGVLFAYAIRAENACGAGSLGNDSSGNPRQGVVCP